MKRILLEVLILGGLLLFMSSCAATQPRDEGEMMPAFNADPRLGIIIIEGSAAAKIDFYDQADRLIESWNEKGANPSLVYNGRTKVRGYKHKLEYGEYRIEILPFYYPSQFYPQVRNLAELPRPSNWISVNRIPSDYYDYEYTKRHWGWILRIYTGDIPQNHYQSPLIDIRGTGIMEDAVEWLRRR